MVGVCIDSRDRQRGTVSARSTTPSTTSTAGSAPGEQSAAAQHSPLQGAENQEVDGDADEQDQEDCQEDLGHAGVVAAVLQQLAQPHAQIGGGCDDLGG